MKEQTSMRLQIRRNYPRIVKIEDVKKENEVVKTFLFQDKLCRTAQPGQYVMIWIPGLDEVPMSLSYMNKLSLSGVSVEKVGEATEELHKRTVGDIIGVRGPFGNYFKPIKGKVVLIGGGTGLVPLIPLAEVLKDLGSTFVFVTGFKTEKDIFFLDRLRRTLPDAEGRLFIVTEDGSYGAKGLPTDILRDLLAKESFDLIYTCGPELMMRAVFEIAEERNTPIQACLERLIRCSVGVCGSCVIGRFRVCKDGLVLSSEQLREVIDEFGRFKRDFDGKKINV